MQAIAIPELRWTAALALTGLLPFPAWPPSRSNATPFPMTKSPSTTWPGRSGWRPAPAGSERAGDPGRRRRRQAQGGPGRAWTAGQTLRFIYPGGPDPLRPDVQRLVHPASGPGRRHLRGRPGRTTASGGTRAGGSPSPAAAAGSTPGPICASGCPPASRSRSIWLWARSRSPTSTAICTSTRPARRSPSPVPGASSTSTWAAGAVQVTQARGDLSVDTGSGGVDRLGYPGGIGLDRDRLGRRDRVRPATAASSPSTPDRATSRSPAWWPRRSRWRPAAAR